MKSALVAKERVAVRELLDTELPFEGWFIVLISALEDVTEAATARMMQNGVKAEDARQRCVDALARLAAVVAEASAALEREADP